jgi:methylated-DNA-[protein]-cysteine S-methyltransferase
MVQFTFHSPIGAITLFGSENGISRIRLQSDLEADSLTNIPEALREGVRQLTEYFNGTRKEFDLRLDFGDAPAFHVEVWKMVKLIPYGRTRTYGDIAEDVYETGRPDRSTRTHDVVVISKKN